MKLLIAGVVAVSAFANVTGVTPLPADKQPPASETQPNLTPEQRGDIMMARKLYLQALELYLTGADKDAVLANKTGIAYHQLNDQKDAEKYYKRAVKLNKNYAEALNNLGTAYYAKKSYGKAISQYKKALKNKPGSAVMLSNLGTAYFEKKKYKEALEAYQEALVADPEIFEQHGSQAVLLQEHSVGEKGLYYYTLAKTYAKAGAFDRALQNMKKALDLGFKEKERFLKDPEFVPLKDNAEFQQILSGGSKGL